MMIWIYSREQYRVGVSYQVAFVSDTRRKEVKRNTIIINIYPRSRYTGHAGFHCIVVVVGMMNPGHGLICVYKNQLRLRVNPKSTYRSRINSVIWRRVAAFYAESIAERARSFMAQTTTNICMFALLWTAKLELIMRLGDNRYANDGVYRANIPDPPSYNFSPRKGEGQSFHL